jgi:hypothetical protein
LNKTLVLQLRYSQEIARTLKKKRSSILASYHRRFVADMRSGGSRGLRCGLSNAICFVFALGSSNVSVKSSQAGRPLFSVPTAIPDQAARRRIFGLRARGAFGRSASTL